MSNTTKSNAELIADTKNKGACTEEFIAGQLKKGQGNVSFDVFERLVGMVARGEKSFKKADGGGGARVMRTDAPKAGE